MPTDNNTRRLYNALKTFGYKDIPEYANFEGKLKDSAVRESLYGKLKADGVQNLPNFTEFEEWLGYPMPDDLKQQQITNQEDKSKDSFLDDLGDRFMAGTNRTLGSVANLLDKGTKVLENTFGIDRSGTFGEAAEAFNRRADEYRKESNRYNGKDFVQLAKEGDWSGALGEIFLSATESAPQSLGIIASGGTGLTAAGLMAANDKYDQLIQDNPNMNRGAALVNSAVTGLSEYLTECLGAGAIGKLVRRSFALGGKEAAGKAISDYLTSRSADFMAKHGIIGPVATEAMEEMINAATEYGTDLITGVQRDDSFGETVAKAGVYGAAGGAQFTPMTVAANYVARRRQQNAPTEEVSSQSAAKNREQMREEAVQRGKSMPESDYHSAYQSSNQSRQSLSDIDPNLAATIDRYVNDDSSAAEVQSLFDGLDETVRPLAEAYYQSQLVMRGITERNLDDAEAEVQAFSDRIAPFAVPQDDGRRLITTAHFSEGLTEKDVYVKTIEGDNAVIFNDDGTTRMVSAKRLQNSQEQDADDLIARYRENALDGKNTQMEFRLHHHPKTQPAQPGLVIFNGDKAYILQERDERGDWVAFPAVLDTDTGQTTAKKGGEPSILTDAEVLELQDLMYAAQEPGNQVNEEAEKTSGVLSETPNVSDETLGENPAGSVSPEERLTALTESLPKTKDGAIDYKRLTPQQQYEYTSLTDSPEVALEDIRRNIAAGNREIDALDRQLEKATGGKLTEIRDKMRAKREEVKGLKELYREVAPSPSLEEGQAADVNGYPFATNPDGDIDFGSISSETGLAEAPIRLVDGTELYGKEHIERNHGEQIRNAGFDSVEDFVSYVASNYDTIREGNNYDGKKTYLVELTDRKNNTLFVELSSDGSYWNVNSAGVFRKGYSKKKDIVWTAPAVGHNSTTENKGVANSITGDKGSTGSTSGDSPQTISSEGKGTQPAEENQAISEENARPSADDMLDTLLDGSLSIEEVDAFVDANRKDVGKRLADIDKKKPVPGTNLAEYKRKRAEWQNQRDAVQQEADYWEDINNRLQESRRQPGDDAALNVLKNQMPQTGEELAAEMLADGSIKLLRDDYMRETGGGRGETRGLFGLFAGRDKGGMTIEQAGEVLMQADLEQGTNLFDQSDPNAGRNAIIEVLSEARTRGDLINYVRRSREEQARRAAEAEYNEYAEWCEANFRMSPEDYEAYVEAMERDFRAKMQTPEAFDQVSGEIYDEMLAQQQEYADIDAALAQSNTIENENIERNDEGGGSSLREGSDEVLPETQPRETGRTGETQGERETGADARGEDGAAQEGSEGRIEPVGNGPFGPIYDQFKGDAQGAIRFLSEQQDGEAIAALNHPDVGDIDLVWGKPGTAKSNGYGLSKLVKFHPELLDNLQGILNDMQVATRSDNRINLESPTHKVAVRLEWDGERKNWLLTAFEKETPTSIDRTTDIGENPTDLQNDTAPLQNVGVSSEGKGSNISSENQTSAPEFIPGESEFDYAQRVVEANKRKAEERKVDTSPTEAQKEAGNYKKGHIKLDGFDITIENPKGNTRSGVDANGNPWSVTMNNTYGYIRGTEGVDGDHIDVFLSDDPTQGDVFVIDQVKADGTFDEHKVMYGFPSEKAAREAYLANYSPDWQGLGNITQVSKEEFKKWVDSSKRKTKPFGDYKNVRFRMAKTTQEENDIITQAKINGTYLKAPNGENTNLSEYQWIQVRTKAFKDWFGDWENNPMEASKIVDENGEPMVVYHGSLHNFDVFGESIKRKTNVDTPDGVYFMTTNRDVASSYAGTDENVILDENKKIKSVFTGEYLGGIYPLFANVRRPLVLDYKGMPWRTSFDDDINKKVLEARESEFDGVIAKNIMDFGPFGNSASNRNTTANDIVVFSPNQMKSATDNTGTYSTKDNNIRFRFIGERGAANLDRAEEATTRMDNLSVARDMENAFNEKQARIEKLRESKPVEITGEEYKGKYELKRDSAKAWIKDNLRGEYTINDTNETVAIGRKGINKVTSHSMGNEAHLKSLIAVPDIIQNAIFITEEVAEKKNAQYPKYRYYVVGLKIGGEDYTVKVTIGVDENGNKYYDHALTEIEKGTLIDNLNVENQNANGFISTGAEPNPSVTDSKDTKLRTILQTNDRENARKIKMATGWERGADGKWRYETPDIELTLPENIEEDKDYKLTDFVKDDELFKAYPHMKDYKVRFENQPDEYGSGGYGSEMIVINTAHSYPEHYESIFVHEIQHGIQAHEGFESGDNPDGVIDRYLDAQSDIETADVGTLNAAAFIRKKAERLIKRGQYKYMRWAVRSAMGTMKGRNRMYEAYGPIETLALHHTSKELHEAYEKAFNEGGSLLNSGLPTAKEAERLYKRNAGEVESRNVERRMEMSPEERRSSLASDTEDISREDQLFIDNALNNTYERRERNTAPQIPRPEANRANPGIGPLEYPNDNLGRPEHAEPRGDQDARGREADGRPQPGTGRDDSQNGTDNGRGNTDARREDRRAGGRNHAAAGRAGEQPRREDRRGGQRGVVGDIESQGDHRGAGGDYRQSGADDSGLGGAARQRRERYRRAVVETARRLGVRVRIVLRDNGQLIIDNGQLTVNSPLSIVNSETSHVSSETPNVFSETPSVSDKTWDEISGMYDIGSGEVYINLSNIRSEADAVRTVLHEVVGHKGLRELIGNEDVYNAEMMRLYGQLPLDARREVSGRVVERYGGNVAIAMDEYLAEQAERGETPSWWQRVVSAVRDMLRRLGIDVELSDNDVKYLLWRSRKRLEAQDGFAVAEDVVMRRRLGVSGERTTRFRTASEESVLDDRNIDEYITEREVGSARDQYERSLSTTAYKFQEAFQDSMLSLKELMDAVAKATKSRILDYENAYIAENAMSSKNLAEMELFRRTIQKKLFDAITALRRKGTSFEEISDYLIAKHGIERNRYMAVKKALSQNEETYEERMQSYLSERDAIRANGKPWLEQQQELDALAEDYGVDLSEDFSGLSSMFPEDEGDGYSREEAMKAVADFERQYDTSDLWTSITEANDMILSKQLDSGLMNKEAYDQIRGMYQFYVPLRGWEQTTADEVYAYLTSDSGAYNAPIKVAKGRKSKAESPIYNLINMAESGILQGNRNLMKQRFLTMAQNHKTDLVSISNLWVRKVETQDAEGNPVAEWHAVFPEIPDKATPEQVEAIVARFDKRMEELSKEKDATVKRSRDMKNIPYKILPRNLREHQVIVKRNGIEYVLTINGNPRAAQALNGLTNPDNATGWFGTMERGGKWLNRHLAANYTTRNPAFMISNFIRDAIYSNTMAWVKENPAYAWKFNRNFWRVNPARIFQLVRRYESGTADMNNPLDRAFREFMLGGGETGYTNLRDIETIKRDVRRELKYANERVSVGKAFNVLGKWFDLFNRSVENTSRFAAYLTSREMGRSLSRSVSDAKEVSVNFNKKGAGSKFLNTEGMGVIGNASALLSGAGQSLFVFWNAGVQGMYNFGKAGKEHKAKFAALGASAYLLGMLIPIVMRSIGGEDDDDNSGYYDLPEYVRRNNICFPNWAGGWITIPLPIELRAIYGLGELVSGVATGAERTSDWKLSMKVAEQMSQVLPLDMLGGGGTWAAFVPSSVKPIYEAAVNTDWTGLPIYKENDFNKYMPEWTKAYSSVDPILLEATKQANALTGGNKYKEGVVDLNPAIIEHVLQGYFGGIETMRSQLLKSAQTVIGDREFEWRNIPVANRVLRNGDERTRQKAVNDAYFTNLEEMDRLIQQERGFRKELASPKNGPFELAEYQKELNDLMRSEEYQNYLVFRDMNRLLKRMNEMFKSTGDEELEDEMFQLKAEMNEVVK